jgi:hypothetical protein
MRWFLKFFGERISLIDLAVALISAEQSQSMHSHGSAGSSSATEATLMAAQSREKLQDGIDGDAAWSEFAALLRHARLHADDAHGENTPIYAAMAAVEATDNWLQELTSVARKLRASGFDSVETANKAIDHAYRGCPMIQKSLSMTNSFMEGSQIRKYVRGKLADFLSVVREQARQSSVPDEADLEFRLDLLSKLREARAHL